MERGNQGDLLLRVMARLLDELPDIEPVEIIGADSAFRESAPMSDLLTAEDELLVGSVRAALATIAAALSADAENPSARSASAALDSIEIVIRGEFVTGREPRLVRFLPSLVFLVALPIVDQDRALVLSQRTVELIDEEIEGS